MAREVARTRHATEGDLPALLDLFDELRRASTRGGGRTAGVAGVDHRADAERRYRAALDDVDSRLLVAVVDAVGPGGPELASQAERLAGMVLCSVASSGTFVDSPSVQMHHFFVQPHERRRGVGRALVAAATAWAEQRGMEGLGVAVYPDNREANRYFARLGFSPVFVHRVASVAALRRLLGAAVPAAAREETARAARRRMRVGITGTRPVRRRTRYSS